MEAEPLTAGGLHDGLSELGATGAVPHVQQERCLLSFLTAYGRKHDGLNHAGLRTFRDALSEAAP